MEFEAAVRELFTPESLPTLEYLENLPEPEHLPSMCRYTNKRCFNERAVKRDGQQHNLCELHRRKANNSQRRFERRRRLLATHSAGDASATTTPANRRVASKKPKKTATPRLAPHYRAPTPRRWRSAADMSIEDMARILAEADDGVDKGLLLPPPQAAVDTSTDGLSAFTAASAPVDALFVASWGPHASIEWSPCPALSPTVPFHTP